MVKKFCKKVFDYLLWTAIESGIFDKWDDEKYLKFLFRMRMKQKLDLENPKTFNEKMQWLKLNDRKAEYTKMVDKYEAKGYVAQRLGGGYIIPTLGVWDCFDEIDFDALPEQFVLKCTHDSGGLVICRDKSKLNLAAAKEKIEGSLKTNYYLHGREWPYKNVKPRIIAEQYMDDKSGTGLTDYKFYCFDGEPKFLYISSGLENHKTAAISFLTLDWEFAPFGRSDYKPFEKLPDKPSQLEVMLSAARRLSAGHPFIRTDFYQIDEQVYFSELTFSPCGGFMPFQPKEWDRKLGDYINLTELSRC